MLEGLWGHQEPPSTLGVGAEAEHPSARSAPGLWGPSGSTPKRAVWDPQWYGDGQSERHRDSSVGSSRLPTQHCEPCHSCTLSLSRGQCSFPVCPSDCLSLAQLSAPCATAMSRSPPAAEDQTFLLEYRCHPLRSGPPAPTSPPGKRNPDPAMGCFPLAEPRRIVLSTDSPAALKVGTQQLIPRSLAVSTKTKNPTRNPSTGSIPQAACSGQKRASVPSVTVQGDTEEDGGGMLKRNLRNMSYRAAMKGAGTEMEPVSTVPTLKPMLEEGSAPPARSPGRSKVGLVRGWSPVVMGTGVG